MSGSAMVTVALSLAEAVTAIAGVYCTASGVVRPVPWRTYCTPTVPVSFSTPAECVPPSAGAAW